MQDKGSVIYITPNERLNVYPVHETSLALKQFKDVGIKKWAL